MYKLLAVSIVWAGNRWNQTIKNHKTTTSQINFCWASAFEFFSNKFLSSVSCCKSISLFYFIFYKECQGAARKQLQGSLVSAPALACLCMYEYTFIFSSSYSCKISLQGSIKWYVFHGLYKWYILDDDKIHKQPDFGLLNTGRDRSDHDKEVKWMRI